MSPLRFDSDGRALTQSVLVEKQSVSRKHDLEHVDEMTKLVAADFNKVWEFLRKIKAIKEGFNQPVDIKAAPRWSLARHRKAQYNQQTRTVVIGFDQDGYSRNSIVHEALHAAGYVKHKKRLKLPSFDKAYRFRSSETLDEISPILCKAIFGEEHQVKL